MSRVRPQVHVHHGDDPYAMTRHVLEALPVPEVRGKFVLVKPNAGRMTDPGSGVTTHPQVVAAVVDYFRDLPCGRLAVGESPILGVKALEALEKTGIAEEVRRRGVELLDLDARDPVITHVPDGRVIDRLKLCAEVTEADYLVSVPVVKTHMHTGVTLGIKNLKGCLYHRQKVKLHQLPNPDGLPTGCKSLDVAVADMATILRADMTVVDGTTALEGLGPSAGTPRKMNLVIAGTDMTAVDAVTCHLMGIDPHTIHHLRLCGERGLGTIDLDDIDVSPDDWRNYTTELEPPPTSVSITYRDVVVHDCESCSACLSTVLLFLKRFADRLSDYHLVDDKFHIALGKAVTDAPDGTVFVGNCTAANRGRGPWVKGCPPVCSAIIEALEASKTKREPE